ncbi:septal ring lytic transglycosylase RlpA family protein [Anaerobiospirillum succiniciproducens]|uniref:septal ring lytic transglycosylase RlpA family protein n=1 Tax=Anaerobiospirillum succiniciproducens TaxID=13335 RepID=UPI00248D9149|nr:septal ring lytic transglycosylase RlpA family protein [Anaerobiospirillum succiniciproducens]
MKANKLKFSSLILAAAFGCSALLLNGCASSLDDVVTTTHGSKAGDGYTYGTGPNKTKPYPQSEKVIVKGVPGAKPKYEPVSRGGNKDYRVLGQNYMVWTGCSSYQEVGTASWYGPGFHGNNTSNGERYDQRGFTAAHKNLPLPSYLKVTNLENGKAVIVRVNDRGPFHGSRIIDLSEGAAKAIDMTRKGTAKVKLELINVRGSSNVSDKTQGVGGQVIAGVLNGVFGNGSSVSKPPKSGTAAAIGAGIYVAGKIIENTLGDDDKKGRAAPAPRAVADTNSTTNYTVDYAAPPATVVAQSTTVQTTTVQSTDEFKITPAIPGTSYVQVFSSSTQAGASKLQAKLRAQTPLPVVIMQEENLFRVRVGPLSNSDLHTTLEYMKQLGYPDAFIKHL